MHGAFAGAPRGERHGNFKHGRRSIEAGEWSKWARGLAEAGEVLLAVTLDDAGLGRKLPKVLRRRAHVRRARAEAKARKQGEKTE